MPEDCGYSAATPGWRPLPCIGLIPLILMRSLFVLLFGCLLSMPALAQRHQEAWDLMKMRQLDTARMVADQDVASDSGRKQAVSWYVRGMVYKSIYDRDDYGEKHQGENIDLIAFDSYKRAIALDVNHQYTDGILEDVLSLTEDFCRQGLDLFEKGYDSRNAHQLAISARYLDAVSEAMQLLGTRQVGIYKTLQEYGIDKRTLEVCRALAKDNSGNREEALRLYEDLVTQKTQEPAVYLSLKEQYTAQNRRGRALAVLEQGRKQVPKSMEIALAYAELLADTGRSAEGRALAYQLHKEHPQEAAPLASLGFIEEKRLNAQKAEDYYVEALDLEPNDFMANFRLGKLYFKRVEEAKARKATQLYIRDLEEKSLHYAEVAAQADPKHPGNCRIMLELYNALGFSDKAQLLRTEMN